MSNAPVVIRDLAHAFGSGGARRQVLCDVSLEIRAGEIVILTGPSGSGKSTLLTLVGALRSVQSGEVSVLGQRLHGVGDRVRADLRRRIGFIFQQHNLIESLTIAQNVEVALQQDRACKAGDRRRRAVEALQSVGLSGEVGKYPEQLSGGQKQRVGVARALATSPELILADEPTASLDKASGREVIVLLRELAERNGCPVVLVTHDHRILDIADRIVHLEDGRIAAGAATVEMVS